MPRYTASFDPEMMNLLKERAELNGRSVNKEIIILIESALAAEVDGNLQILRMLMKANGGYPQPQAPEDSEKKV